MTAQVMKRAWEIARAAATIYGGKAIEYIRGGAVKMAWREILHKPATKEQKIEALEAKGFKRWQKAGYDRLYANASVLGLECEYYNTGNVKNAWFNGKMISNCEARRMKGAKTYINVKTMEAFSGNETLKAAVNAILKEIA